MPSLTKLDSQRRITIPRGTIVHEHYLVDISADGTITLTPAIVRTALEDALRARPGYIDALERDATDST